MKKAIFSILFQTILFAFSFESGKACDAGYTSATCTFNYTVPSSTITGEITIIYCYKCGVSSNNSIAVPNYVFIPHTLNGYVNTQDFFDAMRNSLMNCLKELCTIPPCPQQSGNFEIKKPACAKIVNDYPNSRFKLVYCSTDIAYCSYLYKLCMDNMHAPPILFMNLISTTAVGTAACNSQFPDIPPTGKLLSDDWETECYVTPCVN